MAIKKLQSEENKRDRRLLIVTSSVGASVLLVLLIVLGMLGIRFSKQTEGRKFYNAVIHFCEKQINDSSISTLKLIAFGIEEETKLSIACTDSNKIYFVQTMLKETINTNDCLYMIKDNGLTNEKYSSLSVTSYIVCSTPFSSIDNAQASKSSYLIYQGKNEMEGNAIKNFGIEINGSEVKCMFNHETEVFAAESRPYVKGSTVKYSDDKFGMFYKYIVGLEKI